MRVQNHATPGATDFFRIFVHMSRVTRHDLEQTLKLRVLDAGIEPEGFFRSLEGILEATPDGPRALRNLARFLESGFSSTQLRDFIAHPVLLRIFLQLAGQSQYLADILVRNPEWFQWLTTSDELHRTKSAEDLRAEIQAAIGAFESAGRRKDALKRFHRREILRIGAADILGESSHDRVVRQLSSLAEVIIDQSVSEAYADVGWTPPEGLGLSVFGLGKLGGGELNFSSDIDLLFVYDTDGDLDDPLGRIRTYHEFFVRVGEEIVEFLSGFSDEGYFYRVDMRLRPDGRSGPLAMSRTSYVTYYETRGAQWERQMLLKARCVGGDRIVGEGFLKDISPFVYRRTMLTSPWQDIASMKRAIEEEFGIESNIKLGSGGIRDIEFLVQGLQLIHGGNEVTLRSPNTVETLRALNGHGVIGQKEATALEKAYVFLRDVEHRLQLFHGLQTHEIPESDEEFGLLGMKLGYSRATFRRHLERHRKQARESFRHATKGMGAEHADDLRSEERRLVGNLSGESMKNIRTDVLKGVRTMPDPAVAAHRVGALLDASSTRAVMSEALRSTRLRRDIIRTLGLSSLVFERLLTDPLLLETIIGQAGPLLGTRKLGWTSLADHDPVKFKKYNEVRSAVRLLARRSTYRSFERELTAIAETVIQSVCKTSELSEDILVVGAGKLGSGEMGISSDLDLVLLFDESSLDREEAQKEGKKFTSHFTGPTRSYEVDHRLRPEGGNAPLVASIGFLKDYISTRAELWERMALTRARPLWGRDDLQRSYVKLIQKGDVPSRREFLEYVRSMRFRMETERESKEGIDVKLGPGGSVDIEFIAQTGMLLARRTPGRPTLSVLRSLKTLGMIRQRELHLLDEALAFLRTVETIIRLNSSVSSSVLQPDGAAAVSAAWFLGEKDADTCASVVRRRMSTVRRLYSAILERWRRG